MARLSENERLLLRRAGKMNEFLALRKKFREEGLDPGTAQKRALAKFLDPVDFDWLDEEKPASEAPAAGAMAKPALPPTMGNLPGPVAAKQEDFSDRRCGVVEAVYWVLRNLDILDVDVKTCPDPMAWTMLNMARTGLGGRMEFLQTMVPRLIPARGLLEGGAGPEGTDGAPLLETIERLKALKAKVEGAG